MAAGYHPELSAFAARCALFPLPEGEGQGEGKRRERPARVSDHPRNCRTGRVLRRSRRFPKMTMSETRAEAERQKQMRAAEELLFAGPQKLGVAKGLFLGRFVADWVMPYPTIQREEQVEVEDSLARLRVFLDQHLDPAAIDRQADIPRDVVDGLAQLGVFGMTAPKGVGGRGLSQMAYCRVMEE